MRPGLLSASPLPSLAPGIVYQFCYAVLRLLVLRLDALVQRALSRFPLRRVKLLLELLEDLIGRCELTKLVRTNSMD